MSNYEVYAIEESGEILFNDTNLPFGYINITSLVYKYITDGKPSNRVLETSNSGDIYLSEIYERIKDSNLIKSFEKGLL